MNVSGIFTDRETNCSSMYPKSTMVMNRCRRLVPSMIGFFASVLLLLCLGDNGALSFQFSQPTGSKRSCRMSRFTSLQGQTESHTESKVTLRETNPQVSSDNIKNSFIRSIRRTAVSMILGLSIVTGGLQSSTTLGPSMIANAAADPNAIVGCLFQKCAVQLGKCIASPLCLANVVCINTCNDRPDEIECQIKCGDTFDNPAIAQFNKCAVSDMSCVPQQQDTGLYPVPSRDITVPKFNTNFFNGRLYITAGT
jgi:VDE lipocalin domain